MIQKKKSILLLILLSVKKRISNLKQFIVKTLNACVFNIKIHIKLLYF